MNLLEILESYKNADSDEAKQSVIESLQTEFNQFNSLKDDLSSQLERLKSKNSELISEKQRAKEEAEEIKRKSMSSDELKADFDKRLSEQMLNAKAEYDSKYSELETSFKSLIDSNKSAKLEELSYKIASELSNNPRAFLPHVRARLGAEFEEGQVSSYTLNPDGTRSSLTVDELKAELQQTDYLSPFLKSDFSNPAQHQEPRSVEAYSPSKEFQGDALGYLNKYNS